MMLRYCYFLCMILIAPVHVHAQGTPSPLIITSLQPLGLIVSEIVGDHGQVKVLLPSETVFHDYRLTAADRAVLSSASLVLWVGEALEPMLAESLKQRLGPTLIASKLKHLHWSGDFGHRTPPAMAEPFEQY